MSLGVSIVRSAGISLPALFAGFLRSLPKSQYRKFRPQFGPDDPPEVDFLASFFSSWTLILLFPPRRGARSFQRAQSTTTGINIVRRIVTPMTIHNLVVPDITGDGIVGAGRDVWQLSCGKETEQGAVVGCMVQVL